MATETEIKKILTEDWDPIGIGSDPHAINEYDRYVYELLQLSRKHLTKEELVAYLVEAENYIGVPNSDSQTLNSVAEKLIKLLT